MKGISIIICCFNSATRLPETIKHLALQQLPGTLEGEIIIVDNASTDNTKQVAQEEWNKYSGPNFSLNVVEELKPGLSFARKRGIFEAKYDYLIFCDDDNWLFPDYLSKAFSLMEGADSIGLIGAKGLPVFEGEEAPWFKDCYEYYALGSQTNSWMMYGAGAVCRAKALRELFDKGFESLLTDRKGNTLSSGGDLELSIAISLMGYRVFGCDELLFYHFMPKSRITKKYFKKMLWGTSKSLSCLKPYIYKYSLVHRKPYQRSWIWIGLINFSEIIRNDLLSKNIVRWSFPNQIARLKYLGYLIGLYTNRKILHQGFKSLDAAKWVHEKYKH